MPKKNAAGLVAACRRSATAIRPKSSEVAPYWCMYRVANIPAHCAGVNRPNGDDQLKLMSFASALSCCPCTPDPNRRHDRSLNARYTST